MIDRDQRNYDRYSKIRMRYATQATKRKTTRYNPGDRGERRRGRYHKEHHSGHAQTVWNEGHRRRNLADGSRYGEHCKSSRRRRIAEICSEQHPLGNAEASERQIRPSTRCRILISWRAISKGFWRA